MSIFIVIKRISTYSSGISDTVIKAFTSRESANSFIKNECVVTSENMWFAVEETELV